MTSNVHQDTAWNIPKCRLSLIRIFPYMDRIVSVFSRIYSESEIQSKCRKIRLWFWKHTVKYGAEKAWQTWFVLIQNQKIKKDSRIIKVCVNLEIKFWYRQKCSCYVIILVLQWKTIYLIFDEDFQKSDFLFKLTKNF